MPPNPATSVDTQLLRLEAIFDTVAAAVRSGDPAQVEASSTALRQAAVEFSSQLQGLPANANANANVQTRRALKARLKKIASALATQRANLIRRSVVVERTLHAMVPGTMESTYGSKANTNSPYAGALKQSGAFKGLAA